MLINGIELEEFNAMRDSIKNNFGSLYRFSSECGFSYSIVKKVFLVLDFHKKDFEKIRDVYNSHVKQIDSPFISNDERAAIRMTILSNFYNMKAFTKKHKDYNSNYLSNVLGGRLKLKTTKYTRLVLLLEKKYGLEIKN